jgi:hypothetical protein
MCLRREHDAVGTFPPFWLFAWIYPVGRAVPLYVYKNGRGFHRVVHIIY